MNEDDLIHELEKGLGKDGDLVLGIFCRHCGSHFEIGREGAAMAIVMKTPFIEYLRWVQNSKCEKCHPKESR